MVNYIERGTTLALLTKINSYGDTRTQTWTPSIACTAGSMASVARAYIVTHKTLHGEKT